MSGHDVEFYGLCDVAYPWVPKDSPKTIDIPGEMYDRDLGARSMAALGESARQLERLGFDGGLITEQHGGSVGLISQAMIAATWMAAATQHLRIAAVGPVLNSYLTPVRLAEEIALVDNLSGGRLSVGLPMGIGSQYHAYGVTNPSWARGRFQEAHELLIRAMSEIGPFHFQGAHFEAPYVNLWPRPLQQPYPEIWIPAAGSRESLGLAAEFRHTYMQVLVPWTVQRKNAQLFRELCAEQGYVPDPRQVVWVGSIYVAETDEQARLEFEATQAWIFQSLGLSFEDAFPPGQVSLPSFRGLVQSGGYRIGDDNPDAMTWEKAIEERWLVAGSPATVVEQLRAITDELGAGRIVFDSACMPMWMKEKCLTLMAEEVLPAFRQHSGGPVWRSAPGPKTVSEVGSPRQRTAPQLVDLDGVGEIELRLGHVVDARLETQQMNPEYADSSALEATK
ncbi:LLM class flavin-dependent oxidoreductase [Nocardia sp. NPDC059239]|uniref:LLM class flavin-dependent oxidoreductase n=1 Tax=unclassified Nocardia TaxID=2637762 RepID=UPI0036767185